MYLQQILFFNDPRTLLYRRSPSYEMRLATYTERGLRILHKHICFISTIRKIFDDCCDHCPEPSTPEEFSAQVEEDKIFIRDQKSGLEIASILLKNGASAFQVDRGLIY
ncbi:hypothetical protein GLOIN_2v1484668 [Rhizophagus irregularis DAOM 181602=DAOM 197198]|uniref:Uncharacterized protein n=1 Tax=Rhizophagus irregularis (strain DAOM 181602 / DAOM 197198 / MUCL 43194) TaxID=747089 RepID=A0A2P4PDI3_RHIID|nr:hypothetical protein GLOIN_2v1484668 [Rhizophagus irregularis DAOM 181602=DAOM 197198]POG63431.1 hypothetical protein GLOIN_2v1484668 [Rhizophagus irregularis DAOM 181602=DAOM 197198]|eukprot:XP_025170297.1 hypothetical protein GLOIN_2v1484668 [Rhizophagus irregularis DAOM 181602=DAOM 197198]